MDAAAINVIDFGVDYITVTATHPPRSKTLIDVAKENLALEAEAGNEVTKWRGLGYHGLSCGGVSYGVGPQGVIARMTSGYARENWRPLFLWGMKCTRIDVQVTVRYEQEAPAVLSQHWKEVKGAWLERGHGAEPKVTAGPRGIERITLASRQSERYGRIYDKGVESKLPYYENSIRYEGEMKGAVAMATAQHLVRQPVELATVLACLLRFFRKHSVPLEWAKCLPAHISGPARHSDRGRQLAYLHKCIRPLVHALMCADRPEEVLAALGLEGEVRLAALK